MNPLDVPLELRAANRRLRLVACLLSMASSLPAGAVDFVPMGGIRFGGELEDNNHPGVSRSLTIDSAGSYGGIIDVPLPADFGPRAIELYFSRQQAALHGGELGSPAISDISVSVWQVGLADSVTGEDPRLSWLLIGTAGTSRFATIAGNDTRPSIGVGGAVRWMANSHIGLRGDLRALVNFTGGSGTAVACTGGCNLFYSGSVVVQGEASIGLVLRF